MNGKTSSGFAVPGSRAVGSSGRLNRMREAGRAVALAVQRTVDAVEPGISTRELDEIALREIKALGARPAFLGLYGFPATVCISINEEIVHGIPGERVVESGDVVSLDCGAVVEGMYSDHAVTVVAGAGDGQKDRLLAACLAGLSAGIEFARPGNRVGDISHAIEERITSLGFRPVRDYVGHGIGEQLHLPPDVPNFGPAGTGPLLTEGMCLAIEPMVTAGGPETRTLDDGWTVVARDGSPAAHFEHTVLITSGAAEVITVPGD